MLAYIVNMSFLSRRSVTPRDLSNTGSPAGFPKTRAKKRRGMLRIKSAMLSLCLCECGPHSPIATFPSLSIFSNWSLILACLANGCPWIASWTRVTNVFKLKEKGFPNCPNPVCTSGNTLRTHPRVIVAGRDGNSMFGCEIIKCVVQVSVLVA